FGLMLKMCMHFCTSGQMSDLHSPTVSEEEPSVVERRRSPRMAQASTSKSDSKKRH
ncbi:longevity-assurance protein (LAG1) domain-containing protein, partial [Toxoplasma gondii GAB2-2007-GAL-DOM2]